MLGDIKNNYQALQTTKHSSTYQFYQALKFTIAFGLT